MIRVGFGALALLLLLLTLFLFPPVMPEGSPGFYLPSPEMWHLPRFGGWILGVAAITLCALIIGGANKRFNFVAEAEPVISLALVLLLGCNCLTSFTLSTSTLLLLGTTFCLYILFSTYEARNATREFFIIATFPAVGAMFQYSFLLMIPIFIGGGLLMKSFRIKEFIAFLFGLAAPYWIAFGLGLIDPSDFIRPEITYVFNSPGVGQDIFLTLLAAGGVTLLGVILSLYNGVTLFSRNSRLRCMHSAINLTGVFTIVAVIVDFSNFTAYFGLLVLWLSIEVAALLSLYNIRRTSLALLVLLIIFIPFYILEL